MWDLKRILLPTDFSEYSKAAVDYACEFAERFSSELHLLHVVPHVVNDVPEFGMGLAFPAYPREGLAGIEKLEAEAIAALTRVLDPAWEEGKKVTLAVKVGTPFVEIIRYVKTHAIDLIVMGTHGRSGLSHTLLGSVAEKVVRKAPCPVLTVRPPGHRFEMP